MQLTSLATTKDSTITTNLLQKEQKINLKKIKVKTIIILRQ